MQSPSLPSRAAAWSLGVAVAVLGLKLLAWRWTGSVALYSDALESLVNVGAAATALLALRYSARPAVGNAHSRQGVPLPRSASGTALSRARRSR